MNRTLKFRAWDTKHGNKMVSVRSIDWMEDGTPYAVHYAELDARGDEYRITLAPDVFHLMQFTGLTDKNGKEIYEGDIVVNNDHRFEVQWQESGFFLRNVETGVSFIMLSEHPHSEIIGNIYENPNLLSV